MEPQCNVGMFTRAELLEASVELRHHALGYVKSTALRCAVKLGVANAIQRRGGRASVEDLLTELSLDASRLRCLHSVMRALAALGVFKEGSDGEYGLTAVSSLLVDDDSSVRGSLRPITLLYLEPAFVAPVLNLADWALAGVDGSDDDNNCSARGTAFKMTHGEDVWDVLARDAFLGDFFNGALASETRFLMDIAIRGSPQVFEGIASLVDAGGGTGAAAQAVAAAFPDTRCTVLELPQVVDAAPIDGPVRFVGGDMTKFIPPADAVLLKVICNLYLVLNTEKSNGMRIITCENDYKLIKLCQYDFLVKSKTWPA